MSANSALEFVNSAIDSAPRMPAGITTTCSELGGGVRVTLAKGVKSRTFDVSAGEAAMIDSDKFLACVHLRLESAIAAVNGARVPKGKRVRRVKVASTTEAAP